MLILDEDIIHQELHPCATFTGDTCIINYVALRVNNSVAVIGADRIHILHNTQIDAGRFSNAIEHVLSERCLDIGSTHDLVLRVRGHRLSIWIEQCDASGFDVGRNSPTCAEPVTRPFACGRHYSMNIGHTLTAFGLVEVTANGCALKDARRVPTGQLQSLHDIMRFIDGCTSDFKTPDILSNDSDYRLSLSIAEPVLGGQVAFNRKARVSCILLELQDGLLRDVWGAGARDAGRVGKYFVVNDSCSTGIYASRAAASYANARVSGVSPRALAIRFGTYSAISYIGDDGYNPDRFNEYSYLRIGGGPQDAPPSMSVVGSALSHNVLQDREYPAPADSPDIHRTAGHDIARLVAEVRKFNAIENVVVLGSAGNGLDDAAWAGMRKGIEEGVDTDGGDLPLPRLTFLPDASRRSSLLGAAMEHSERLALTS